MPSSLALALVALEEAKRRFRWRLCAHLGTLTVALVGIFLPHQVEYFAAVVALVSEGAAWCFHHSALEWHALGREAMRRALVEAGLGEALATEELADLRRRFGRSATA